AILRSSTVCVSYIGVTSAFRRLDGTALRSPTSSSWFSVGDTAMDTTKKSEEINQRRRSFLGTAAVTVAAAQLLLNGSAEAQPGKTKSAGMRAIKPGANTSFASLKRIDSGLLNVGYAEAGTGDGPVVILLLGWPYDIHSFVDVATLLASQ